MQIYLGSACWTSDRGRAYVAKSSWETFSRFYLTNLLKSSPARYLYLFFLFILLLGLDWSFVIYAMRNVALSVVLAAAAAGATASEESKPTFKVMTKPVCFFRTPV